MMSLYNQSHSMADPINHMSILVQTLRVLQRCPNQQPYATAAIITSSTGGQPGDNRETNFREQWNYYYFLKLAADTFAYCLLPNHFHFLTGLAVLKGLPVLPRTAARKAHMIGLSPVYP
jgi:hypothetical protein